MSNSAKHIRAASADRIKLRQLPSGWRITHGLTSWVQWLESQISGDGRLDLTHIVNPIRKMLRHLHSAAIQPSEWAENVELVRS